MRELEFRVWDTTGTFGMAYAEPRELFEQYTPGDNAVFMQCTGIRDIHGVKIYEGDILRRVHRTQGGGHVFSVKWGQSISGTGFNIGGRSSAASQTSEVVGNIYQNPELLP